MLAKWKKKKSKTKVLSSVGGGNPGTNSELPGNLALVIFVSCMIDTIYDAGAAGGLSPPSSGWMDEYVKAVVEVPVETPEATEEADEVKEEATIPAATAAAAATAESTEAGAPVRRSSRQRSKTTKGTQNDKSNEKAKHATKSTSAQTRGGSPSKRGISPGGGGGHVGRGNHGGMGNRVWIRPDIRNEVAVLTKVLMERHLVCLCDNVKGGEESRMVLVNDDDSFHGSTSPSRRRTAHNSAAGNSSFSGTMKYYPFMHRTLETLGRAAASSSFFASSDGKSCIMAIGSAVALSSFLKGYERCCNDPCIREWQGV